MNFQNKNSNSVVNIFETVAGIYLLARPSTWLLTEYFLSFYFE